jgi:hypothetical protein
VIDQERAAWRAKEAALRAELDAQLAAARARYSDEVEDERRRAAAAARAEAARHMEELARVQGDAQARLDEVARKHAAERDEAARRTTDTAAAEAQVRFVVVVVVAAVVDVVVVVAGAFASMTFCPWRTCECGEVSDCTLQQ